MAFNLQIKHGVSELCDKCRKSGTVERPLVYMWTSGRSYDQRNFIQVHKDCLLRLIAKEETRGAVEVTK